MILSATALVGGAVPGQPVSARHTSGRPGRHSPVRAGFRPSGPDQTGVGGPKGRPAGARAVRPGRPRTAGRHCTIDADEPDCKPDPVSPRVTPTATATIHLGTTLPPSSCDLPGYSGGPPSNAPCLTLLRVGFTKPHRSPGTLVVSYTTVSPLPPAPPGEPGRPGGGLFSVALSRGLPRVGVTHHPALWSPDFPRRPARTPADAVARPTRPGPS